MSDPCYHEDTKSNKDTKLVESKGFVIFVVFVPS
jgi:hypothetical protein